MAIKQFDRHMYGNDGMVWTLRNVITYPMLKLDIVHPDQLLFTDTTLGWNKDVYLDENGNTVYDSDYRGMPVLVGGRRKLYFSGRFGEHGGIFVLDSKLQKADYVRVEGETSIFEYDLPDDAYAMYVSVRSDATDTVFIVSEYLPIDVTDGCSSWQDMEITQERDGTSGVQLGNSFPVKLVKRYGKVLTDMFFAKGYKAKARLNIYIRDRVRFGYRDYELKDNIDLDFTDYQYDAWRKEVGIQGKSQLIQKYLRSKGSTKFDIPVDSIAEAKKFNYERLSLFSVCNYSIIGSTVNDDRLLNMFWMFANPEYVADAVKHDFRDQLGDRLDVGPNNYFFKAVDDVDVNISVKMTVKLVGGDNPSDRVAISKYNADGSLGIDILGASPVFKGGDSYFYIDWLEERRILKDEKLYFNLLWLATDERTYEVELDHFTVSYAAKGTPYNIDVIKPERLLKGLLDRIAPAEGYTCSIDWDEPCSLMLCAAESIRGFNNAYMHTSFNDFDQWMYSFGYEQHTTPTHLTYRKRALSFNPGVTAIEIPKHTSLDPDIVADNNFAWTGIDVGYDKPSYEETAGRYEVMGKFEYNTGYIFYDGSKRLDLVSPYRADSIGLEILGWERFRESTDSGSDNDVFVLALTVQNSAYTAYLDIQVQSGGIDLLNGFIAPNMLVRRNESLIGVCTTQAEFASTDSYREASSPQTELYGNIAITEQLFKPMVYRFTTPIRGELPPAELRDGVVVLHTGDKLFTRTFRGYIKSISKNYGNRAATLWQLYVID